MKQSWPYLVIVIALFLGINAPSLFSEGMFMDGLFYSTISRNLAEGQGTFWDLYFSNSYFTHFYEHPPLAMGIQSLFFRVFGDSIFVERFYSLIIYFLSLYVLSKTWISIVSVEYSKYYWLPLFLFSITGVVGWSVSNNMLENTMTLFVLLSFYLTIKSLDAAKSSIRFLFILLAGISLFLGFLTKGFVALYPLTSLFFYFIFTKKITFARGILGSFVMLFGLITPILFLYLFNEEAITSLLKYFNNQVAGSIKNVSTVNSRFWILWSCFQQLIPVFLFMGVVILFARRIKKIKYKLQDSFYPVLFVGLSGVIPIMISLKQRDFYIVSAYAFICLAISLLLLPYVSQIILRLESYSRYNYWIKKVSSSLLIISLVIIVFQYNRIGRDVKMITDVKKISEIVPEKSIISIPNSLSNNWSLRGYFARYNHIGLTPNPNLKLETHYFLSDREERIEGFKKVDSLGLSTYYLYTNLVK
jgi:4-amino-4-deoxy-L-arabinose transferase-like glycosyltransferase